MQPPFIFVNDDRKVKIEGESKFSGTTYFL
jgi:hypothetical protein